jgi:hypothetical protein
MTEDFWFGMIIMFCGLAIMGWGAWHSYNL